VMDEHNRMSRRLAAWYGLPLADVHARLDGRVRYFMDWVHLTQQGRRILAQTMYQALRPLLPVLLDHWQKRRRSSAGRTGGAGPAQ